MKNVELIESKLDGRGPALPTGSGHNLIHLDYFNFDDEADAKKAERALALQQKLAEEERGKPPQT